MGRDKNHGGVLFHPPENFVFFPPLARGSHFGLETSQSALPPALLQGEPPLSHATRASSAGHKFCEFIARHASRLSQFLRNCLRPALERGDKAFEL